MHGALCEWCFLGVQILVGAPERTSLAQHEPAIKNSANFAHRIQNVAIVERTARVDPRREERAIDKDEIVAALAAAARTGVRTLLQKRKHRRNPLDALCIRAREHHRKRRRQAPAGNGRSPQAKTLTMTLLLAS